MTEGFTAPRALVALVLIFYAVTAPVTVPLLIFVGWRAGLRPRELGEEARACVRYVFLGEGEYHR